MVFLVVFSRFSTKTLYAILFSPLMWETKFHIHKKKLQPKLQFCAFNPYIFR
jgi:hypothetical protein